MRLQVDLVNKLLSYLGNDPVIGLISLVIALFGAMLVTLHVKVINSELGKLDSNDDE